jgi:hypothetical protein
LSQRTELQKIVGKITDHSPGIVHQLVLLFFIDIDGLYRPIWMGNASVPFDTVVSVTCNVGRLRFQSASSAFVHKTPEWLFGGSKSGQNNRVSGSGVLFCDSIAISGGRGLRDISALRGRIFFTSKDDQTPAVEEPSSGAD